MQLAAELPGEFATLVEVRKSTANPRPPTATVPAAVQASHPTVQPPAEPLPTILLTIHVLASAARVPEKASNWSYVADMLLIVH